MNFTFTALLSCLVVALMGMPVRTTTASEQDKTTELPIGQTVEGQKLEYQSLTEKTYVYTGCNTAKGIRLK